MHTWQFERSENLPQKKRLLLESVSAMLDVRAEGALKTRRKGAGSGMAAPDA